MTLDQYLVNFFIYIGQYTIAVYFTYLLLGKKPDWKIILSTGAFIGIAWVILDNTTGNWILATFIHWTLFIAVLSLLKVSGIFETTICVTVTTNICMMYDHICINTIALIINRDPQSLIDNSFMCCRIFALECLLAFVFYLILKHFRLTIFERALSLEGNYD